MKLYYTPGACSLADHIALREAGLEVELVLVDLAARLTEAGTDYTAINPKGYVPALQLHSGEVLTENVAILDWVATQAPSMRPNGALGRSQLIEMLAFIATELHRSFMRLFFSPAEAEKRAATSAIEGRLAYLGSSLTGDYLLGDRFSSADAFLYVMLRWARDSGLALPPTLESLAQRIEARPTTQQVLHVEGLPNRFEDSERDINGPKTTAGSN